MSVDIWERLEDELFPFMESIILGGNNLGEQMSASCWDIYFDRLMKFPLRPEFITNGTLFNDERIEKAVAKECQIRFSIEGATKETFERVRGKCYDLVMNNIKKIHRVKLKHPGNKTVLVFGVTIFRDNIEELPKMVELAAELGVERMEVHHLHPSFPEHRYQSLVYHRSICNQELDEARERAQKLGVWLLGPANFFTPAMTGVSDHHSPEPKGTLPDRCIFPWSWVSINESGEVMPCCAMPLVMGNLKKQSFMDIWNNYKYRHLRRTVNSPHPVGICKHCHDRFDEDHSEQYSRVDDFNLLQKIGMDNDLSLGKMTLMLKYAARNHLRSRKGGAKIIRFLTPIVRRFSL
jgi:MoaA/NifB/PqqE/SkfB family radical SAM enzyme